MTGYFYVGQPIPEYNPRRLKVGFSKNPERRKRDYLTANPNFKIIQTWNCEPEWESVLLHRLNLAKCGLFIGREVVECTDINDVLYICNKFFQTAPKYS